MVQKVFCGCALKCVTNVYAVYGCDNWTEFINQGLIWLNINLQQESSSAVHFSSSRDISAS